MRKILFFISTLFFTITNSLFAQHPTNLFATNLTTTSVVLSWDESMCASFVNLKYRVSGSGAAGWVNLSGLSSPQQLSGLVPNTAHEVTVKCSGISGWAPIINFTTLLALTIDTAFISHPILCYGSFMPDEMQIQINQTSPPTVYSYVIGSYPFGNYFASYVSTNQTTGTGLNFNGFLPNVDYCIRIVDSVAYYNANGGAGSGTSIVGMYDEFCSVNFLEPAQLSATMSTVINSSCFGLGDCNAATDLLISGGTGPYSFALNGGVTQNLSTGVSTFPFSSLCEGEYDIVLTDENGCSTNPVNTSFTIAESPVIIPSGIQTLFNSNGYHVSCKGASDGEITASASGGTGIFTYSIDGINFQSSPIFSNLIEGTYTITYKDANNCTNTQLLTLIEPPLLLGAANITQTVDCFGSSNGEITFQLDPINAGVPPYQYSIDYGVSFQSSNIFINLTGNLNYDVMIVDNNGCSYTSSVFLNEPSSSCSPTISNISIGSPILCYGGYTSMQININQSASPTAFSYLIGYFNPSIPGFFTSYQTSNLSTSANPYNAPFVPAADYCVRLVDSAAYYSANGGSASGISTIGIYDEWCSIIITEPAQLSATTSNFSDNLCAGDCIAATDLLISGGTGPYSFTLDGGIPQNLATGVLSYQFTSLCPGFYDVIVTDANSCSTVPANTSFNISTVDDIITNGETSTDFNGYNVSCNGASDGEITALLAFPQPGDTYSIDGTNFQSSPIFSSLLSGTYTITYKNYNNCIKSEQITITEPPLFNSSINGTNLLCFQDNSGAINLSLTGGVSPYFYSWNNGATTSILSGLAAGNYSVTISDDNGCVNNESISITEPNASISTDTQVHCDLYTWIDGVTYTNSNNTATFTTTNTAGCDNTVTLNLTINNSTSSTVTQVACDSYTWIANGITYNSSGTYTHVTTNSSGCDNIATLNLTINNSTTSTDTQMHCDTYTWIDGFTYTASNNTATFTTVNAAGCDNIALLDLTINNSTTSTDTQIHCDTYTWIDGVTYTTSNNTAIFITTNSAGCNNIATLELTINNSTTSTDTQVHCETYTWKDGVTYTTSNNTAIFITTNSAGCDNIETLDLTINNSTTSTDTQIHCDAYTWIDGVTYTANNNTATFTSLNLSGCNNTTTLDLTVVYSTSTLTEVEICDIYSWSVTSQSFITSGLYISTSTNAAGCLHTDSLNLIILESTSNLDNVGSQCDSFTWPINGQTYYTSQIDTVHSINADGCQHIDSLNLTIYPIININANITDELCVDYSDGSIILNVSGGLESFSYIWTGPNSFTSTTRDIFNLFPGLYSLTITDDLSLCIKDTSFLVGEGFDMQFSTSSNNVSCFGNNDGSIDINPINLISPVYNWSDISFLLEDRINLSPGVYYLQIDDNNCFIRDTFNINQPDSLFLTATQTNTTCANNTFGYISVQVSGGSPSYFYYWSNWINTPLNDGLAPGTYDLDVIDSNGCLLEKTFEIIPYTIDVSSILDNVACYGDSTASIDLTVSGGFQTYSYLWSDNSINQDIYNLPYGNISCTVTDYFGCESIVDFIITQEDEIFSNPVVSGVSCFGGNNGNVVLSIIGGVGLYNIDWNNADENNLSEGSYPYQITDANGCIFHDTVYVAQEDSLESDIIVIDLQCNGDPTGEINVSIISGGVGPFYYSWIGPNSFISNQYIISNLGAGSYDLNITDSNNCNVLYQISLTEPVALSQDIVFELSNYSTFGISCNNGSDGWISATPTGGYIPYSFDWAGPAGYNSDSQYITGLSEGLYSIIVTNGLGCNEEFVFPMNYPEDAVTGVVKSLYDYNGYDIRCYGFNDAAILVEPNGGVSPYTYIWDNVQTLNPLAFQEAGLHLLTMYDNNGCSWESFINLNQPDELIWNINIFPDTCEREVGEIILDVDGGLTPYNYIWSDSQNSAVATQLFEGEYSVEVLDKNGCQIFDMISVSNLISPKMDFDILSDYERLNRQLEDPIIFIDMTDLTWQKALYWDWDFGDGTFGTDSIAFHSYKEIGEYDVLLTITTDYNCIDTLSKKVVIQEYDLFIPNSFTPNSINDNINDEFRAYGIGIDEFRMSIYSRWGELIYNTDNIEDGWNGRFENTENEVKLGIYVYYIETKDVFGAIHRYEGQLTLIR